MWILIVFIVNISLMEAVILNKTAYNEMPPLYGLDNYEECLDDPYGYYCIVDMNLTSTAKSPLYDYIIEFSSNTKKHFRHDFLHRGICLTKSCRKFYEDGQEMNFKSNVSLVMEILQTYVNNSMENQYGLQVKALDVEYCNYAGQTKTVDGLDIAVAVIIITILTMNIIGSIYDYNTSDKTIQTGNSWLLSFSVQQNWNKLTTIGVKNQHEKKYDPRLEKLKCLQGMRFMSMIAVIFSHVTLLVAANYVENPMYIEVAFEDPLKQLLYNGSLIMQTYFCIASFLTAYNFMLFIEKNRNFNVWLYPKGVLNRWLRLTPVCILMLGFVATWQTHLGHGPLWDHVVTTERDYCRANWWAHLLYINNYISLDKWCLPQTWYLGADTQLFCYGLAVMMIIWRFPKVANYLFPSLIVVGMLIPAVLTYVGKYDPTVMQTPESYRTLYKYERTFNDIYIRGHTNTAGPTLALWAGYFLYQIQKREINMAEKFWFRILVYPAFPLGVGVILTGAFFYKDDYVYDPLTAAIYAGIFKVLFSLFVIYIIMGICCGAARPYARILEWRNWQVPGRLTYCALFVHPVLQRAYVGVINKPFFLTDYTVFHFLASSVVMTYILAVPLCVMVEMPANSLQKLLFEGNPSKLREQAAQKPQTTRNISLVMAKDNTQL